MDLKTAWLALVVVTLIGCSSPPLDDGAQLRVRAAELAQKQLIDGVEAIAAEAPEVFGIAHSEDNLIGDSSYVVAEERHWQGLSPFGSEVVAEMNRLGIMIDISHVSDLTFDQVLDLSTAPVIASYRPQRRVPVPQSDPVTARRRVQ